MNQMAGFGVVAASGALGGCAEGCGRSSQGASTAQPGASGFLMPSEEHLHRATVMAFASSADNIWSEPSTENAGLRRVQEDLIDVAKAIGTYEPVRMLVLPGDTATSERLLSVASAANPIIHANYEARASGIGGVTLVTVPEGFNDYWTRDTSCVFVKNTANGSLAAVDFNFNGWGNGNSKSEDAPKHSNGTKKASFFQPFDNDRKVAAQVAAMFGATLVKSTLTLEGGGIEFNGIDTAILTESSVLHVNRNPQLFDLTYQDGEQGAIVAATLKPSAKATVLAELNRTLGVRKVIWLKGTATFPNGGAARPEDESDITNGHADFYAKFLSPTVVAYAIDETNSTGERAITKQHLAALRGQTDSTGAPLTLVPLPVPTSFGSGLSASQLVNFAAGYINFYFCNGAIILPKFNEPASDEAARRAVAVHAGKRAIVQVDILGIASGGGGLHCSTQQVPA